MGAGKTAVDNHKALCGAVKTLGEELSLRVYTKFKAGQTIWGTKRKIDVVLSNTDGTKKLGVSCFSQDGSGTAYIKFFGKLDDTKKYPIRGIIVYSGPGFKDKFRGIMNNYGAIPFEDLDKWARTFFNISR